MALNWKNKAKKVKLDALNQKSEDDYLVDENEDENDIQLSFNNDVSIEDSLEFAPEVESESEPESEDSLEFAPEVELESEPESEDSLEFAPEVESESEPESEDSLEFAPEVELESEPESEDSLEFSPEVESELESESEDSLEFASEVDSESEDPLAFDGVEDENSDADSENELPTKLINKLELKDQIFGEVVLEFENNVNGVEDDPKVEDSKTDDADNLEWEDVTRTKTSLALFNKMQESEKQEMEKPVETAPSVKIESSKEVSDDISKVKSDDEHEVKDVTGSSEIYAEGLTNVAVVVDDVGISESEEISFEKAISDEKSVELERVVAENVEVESVEVESVEVESVEDIEATTLKDDLLNEDATSVNIKHVSEDTKTYTSSSSINDHLLGEVSISYLDDDIPENITQKKKGSVLDETVVVHTSEVSNSYNSNASGVENNEINHIKVQKDNAVEELKSWYDENELVRAQSTIKLLREDREEILSKVKEYEDRIMKYDCDRLGPKAEVDELRIDLSIIKRRHADTVSNMNKELRLSEDKRFLVEEKLKNYNVEFERLNNKVKVDFSKVRMTENELKEQLELVRMDADAQVSMRDKKIFELKRKIDSLEFNMEHVGIREQQAMSEKRSMEEKLIRVLGGIKDLTSDLDDDDNDNILRVIELKRRAG